MSSPRSVGLTVKRTATLSESSDPGQQVKSSPPFRSSSNNFLQRSMSEFQPTARAGSGSKNQNQTYQPKRKYSMVKRGYQAAVPSAYHSPSAAGDVNGDSAAAAAAASITPHVIALVGLPARGKTYISKKLSRYLNWIGINTRVFNLGEYRRRIAPEYQDHSLFAPGNATGTNLREQVCDEALEDVIAWLRDDGEVAVFDATNTTRARRKKLHDFLVTRHQCKLFFVESICEQEDIIEGNIKEVKVSSPDYVDSSEDHVLNDFKKRIAHYSTVYEPLDEQYEDYSYLKIFNAGEKHEVRKHEGHIQSRIVYYLMNVQLTKRTIYLTRHGESEFNVAGKLGGDSSLTSNGLKYGRCLSKYFEKADIPKLKVWTSWLKRSVQTTQYIQGFQERWKALNEIDCGSSDGMTYAEVHSNFHDDFVSRDEDKFTFRYKRGESYEDLVSRLEPVIMELERQSSVLVVAHQAVLRCLLGYYMETPEEEVPWMEVPLHTVVKLEPKAYGCEAEIVKFPVDCVVTHREKPEVPGTLDEKYLNGFPLDERGNISSSDINKVKKLMSSLEITKVPAFTGAAKEEET